jgi:formylglycine-generating enzyme required for sulfatase activity
MICTAMWEWCRDWFDMDFYASGNTVDPVNTKEAKCATCRGGSWYNPNHILRSASRNNWYPPTYRHYNVGFRVVVE